ncbi:BgTH12-01873 [Blumeria graminis f. sp. triticale]|uniref:Bgt-1746 n=3 Tax=Blumeria graminis TaxID=34373 RepID=A0A061HLW3_BLUGR|nr:hypothetical protein BGT96224_1746 [Blumeria graminis f. sp. tritici 96224]CAD6501623.1 BgTH12-01873 [Blumeria graminis f. sp. triticale]VDB84183.1 Bgt-1746 [Blumeria graminis f. sp. tritici]
MKAPIAVSPTQRCSKPHLSISELAGKLTTRGKSSASGCKNIKVKNRRKLYLDAHPSYFTSSDLELADPLLYDKCIRKFQTSVEREADGKQKGYSGVLEADLWRSEAKIAKIEKYQENIATANASDRRYLQIAILDEDENNIKTKEEGWERWLYVMTLRFLDGEDEDFDYKEVDDSDEWDWVERREMEEAWFDAEEPEWLNEDNRQEDTGIQDF